ncbi:hypothetical protein Cthiooxydans_12930 [Comamonas thiooxydans]|nr:hypothetical protein Cthiooxydans_12930 [Comamonas thiooxydans]
MLAGQFVVFDDHGIELGQGFNARNGGIKSLQRRDIAFAHLRCHGDGIGLRNSPGADLSLRCWQTQRCRRGSCSGQECSAI